MRSSPSPFIAHNALKSPDLKWQCHEIFKTLFINYSTWAPNKNVYPRSHWHLWLCDSKVIDYAETRYISLLLKNKSKQIIKVEAKNVIFLKIVCQNTVVICWQNGAKSLTTLTGCLHSQRLRRHSNDYAYTVK